MFSRSSLGLEVSHSPCLGLCLDLALFPVPRTFWVGFVRAPGSGPPLSLFSQESSLSSFSFLPVSFLFPGGYFGSSLPGLWIALLLVPFSPLRGGHLVPILLIRPVLLVQWFQLRSLVPLFLDLSSPSSWSPSLGLGCCFLAFVPQGRLTSPWESILQIIRSKWILGWFWLTE